MISAERFKAELQVELENAFKDFQAQAEGVDALYGDMLGELKAFVLRGGKRTRPYLAYVAYCGGGGTDFEAFLPVAAGLELFHAFLLVHDDIIDRDETRYGGLNPLGAYLAKLKGQRHFAESAALLSGDSLSAMARLLVSRAPFAPHTLVEVLALLDRTLFEVIGGEFVDALAVASGQAPLAYPRVLSMHRFKTASYSFSLPLRMGMLLAGTSPDGVEELCRPLGIAYQMRDDYLGLFGSEEVTGKPVTGDVREGKQTALYALALERASPVQREILGKHYGNGEAGRPAVEAVRKVFKECGACGELERQIEAYRKESLEALEGIGVSKEAKAIFKGLIASSLVRIS